jgi:hypothetical protein
MRDLPEQCGHLPVDVWCDAARIPAPVSFAA